MVDSKSKTKAAMMQELESIKGLLLEDDEIPILQEMITGKASSNSYQPTMKKQDLDELHNQFEALSRSMSDKKATASTGHKSVKPASVTSSNLLDAFTRAAQHQPEENNQPATPTPTLQQPSLFHDDSHDALDDFNAGQQTPSLNFTSESYGSAPDLNNRLQRASLAKAQGENPFLPQHIRARLHGNNPPPLFDYAKRTPPPKASSLEKKSDLNDSNSREQLINSVIATMLPQLEQELYEKLAGLTQEALEHLLNQE
jgi:hypothetical protein